MKSTVVITIITAVLAIAAGVAIAGLPSTPPGADVVVLEVQTVETVTVPSRPDVTVRPAESTATTSTTSTAPASTTTTTIATTQTVEPSPPVESTPDTTLTTEVDDEETADALRERAELSVATANATDGSGVAGVHATMLETVGYVDVTTVDAEASPVSAVYYEPGFELEAARLAIDLDWDLLGLAPMAEIPPLLTERTFELVALVGLDRS